MDDIVVIILTILIAIVGVAGQRKKRRDMQAPGKTQSNKPMDFWELLQQQSQGDSPVQEFEPEMEEEEEIIDTLPEQKPVYQFKAESEGSSNMFDPIKEQPQAKKRKVLIDGEEFSLRKAVIYSEIMNRKYT